VSDLRLRNSLVLSVLATSEFESPYSATSVKSLLSSGASITGKTQMDEFGMGSMTNNLPPGSPPVHNPWIPGSAFERRDEVQARSAGGSSGGSAAAVKGGQAWA
jgi:aspartyl-tRNA(Asn)/glutamyl-tRNA(Gln) amidotransferase subunit A